MHSNTNRQGAGKTTPIPRCLDCGQHHRHADTCPQRTDLLDLLDEDLAALAAWPGRLYVRALHRVERAHLAACGCPAPRQERRRWTVHVEPFRGGVLRTIYRDGQVVAEFEDASVGAT